MNILRFGTLVCLGWTTLAGAAQADACRRADDGASGRKANAREDCRAEDRLRPYEPGSAVRAGRDPGFVDLGNGTEVRVGGRVRMDYDVRR